MTQDFIISVQNLTMLFGDDKATAKRMLEEGSTKETIHRETGVAVALNGISLHVRQGEIFSLIGLSGSGKSTLGRCINLLQRPTQGALLFEDQNIMTFNRKQVLEYRRTKISMVFQSFGLMSHRNVLDNVAYGLEVKGTDKATRTQKAMEMIAMVGLEGHERGSIDSLSGGMRQRVGIARALATEPAVLIMDEPFSALDPLVRRDMQFELLSIQRSLGTTIIFITHDINEAFKMGDTVAIMRDGRVEQIASPEVMSAEPANDYVRSFIDTADKTKVFSVQHIMAAPSCIVRTHDGVTHAIHEMRANGLSSVYVVGEKMRLEGIVTIDDAVRARAEKKTVGDIIRNDVQRTTRDTLISDILSMAAETRYPIAVVDDQQRLRGIVTKAAVLSSML